MEHVFDAINQWGGKRIRTIDQARANFAMGMMVVIYNMRRPAFLGAQCVQRARNRAKKPEVGGGGSKSPFLSPKRLCHAVWLDFSGLIEVP